MLSIEQIRKRSEEAAEREKAKSQEVLERVSQERAKRRQLKVIKEVIRPLAIEAEPRFNPKQPDEYLYKKMEEHFQKEQQVTQEEMIKRALAERKKKIDDSTVKTSDIKVHQLEYVQKLQERHSMGEKRRAEEVSKQKQVAEWLTKSVPKTKIHKIVEEQIEDEKTKGSKLKAMKQQQRQQREAYARAVKESFHPKVSEIKRAEILDRELIAKKREQDLRAIKDQKYRDYLREMRVTDQVATTSPPQHTFDRGITPPSANPYEHAERVQRKSRSVSQEQIPPSRLRNISVESDEALARKLPIDYLTPMRLRRKNRETLAILPHIPGITGNE